MNNESKNLNLDQWLDHIAAIHPREIELGLGRVKKVADSLKLGRPAPKVITVAGTNGKGSCVAYLESLLECAGIKTAAYTSPHLHRFNERIRVGAQDVSDREICEAFSAIEKARGSVSLSYFEYATLAALLIFSQSDVDVALLEVGLGGRLDAVNIIDPDIALITSIALDHQDWLGSDLEVIGFEKAGIMRAGKPSIFADYAMPASISKRASELASPLYVLGQDFGAEPQTAVADSGLTRFSWSGVSSMGDALALDYEVQAHIHRGSLAACIQTLCLLGFELRDIDVVGALARINLPGRFEKRLEPQSQREVILDVAHNPAAASLLNLRLQASTEKQLQTGRVIMVLAVLDDKDIEGIVVSLQSSVDIWYIAQIDDRRGLSIESAMERLNRAFPEQSFREFTSVEEAFEAACSAAEQADRVVVAGSFHTVAIAREHSRAA